MKTVKLPSKLWKEIVWAARIGFNFENDYYSEQTPENVPKDWPETKENFLEAYKQLATQLGLEHKSPRI